MSLETIPTNSTYQLNNKSACLGYSHLYPSLLLSVGSTEQLLFSAVKRLKYLIAIDRIYVIVNSKVIAINRKFVSILVYLFFPSFYFYFNAPINMEKWIGLLYANVLFYSKPTLPNRAVQNKIIKCTFQVNKDSAYSAVKPWLNIFFFSSLLGT